MTTKIISSRPDRRHPGLSKITYSTGVQSYRVQVKGVLDRRYKLNEHAEALHDLEAAKDDRRRGVRSVGTAGRITVAEVIKEWALYLGNLEAGEHLQHGTVINYLGSIKYLQKVHPDLPIVKLGVAQIQEIITRGRTTGIGRADGKKPRPWGKETHKLFTITVKLLLDFAVDRRYVSVNVARGDKTLRSPKQTAATRQEKDHWTTEEMNDLAEMFADDPLAVAYLLGLAGFRLGEMAGLRWEDVHFDEGFILIQNTRVQHTDGVQEKPPKSGKPRMYPLGDEALVQALKAQRRRQREQQMLYRQDYQWTGYVVTQTNKKGRVGQPYQPQSIAGQWQRFLARHGYRHISFHGSRHSFATDAAGTMPLREVQDMLGHASLRTTGIYLHTDQAKLLASSKAAAEARRAVGTSDGRR